MKVLWTEQAYTRLAEIGDFIAKENPIAAARLRKKLIERAESLSTFPNRGRRPPELPGSELREIIHDVYRIVYRVRGKSIEVLTVFEGHRQLPEEDLPQD